MEEEDSHEAMTSLRSELAALQYKRDRLLSELNEMKAQLRCRDQRTVELQSETENLKEQAARQNAVIASLRKRIQVKPFSSTSLFRFWRFLSFSLSVWGPFRNWKKGKELWRPLTVVPKELFKPFNGKANTKRKKARNWLKESEL